MATYKSKHTGERVDNAVTKIPENLPTEDSFIVVKADGSASEYIPQSQVLSDKLDKQTAQTTSDQIYGKLADGSQTMFDLTMGAEPTTIPRRDTAGRIQVADGVSGNDAVNFNQLSAVESSISGLNIQNGDGKDSIQSKYTGEIDATHFGNHCYGESSAVFGEANLNTGNRATVSGKMNRNSAPNSLIVGLGNGRGINANPTINVLSGEQLFVFGALNSVLNGNGNAVLGAENTLSDVRYSTIIGRGNIINNTSLYEGKCVVGRFNNQKPDTMFEVGVGDYNNRVNGFEVYKDGRAKVQTAPKDNTDVVRKLELDRKFDKAGGTVTGDMVVGGNFTVQGKTTTVDSENLRVTDKLIEVGKGNTAPLTSPAGLITPKYDGTNNGGIVYDNTGTAYVGDITLDSNGNVDVNNSDLQPIATRNATITNGNLVKWDGTNHKLVDAGKNVENLVDKLPASLRSQAYVRDKDGNDTGLAYTYTDEGNTLAVRNASGQVQVSTPSQDNDAANKKFVEDNFVAKPVATTEWSCLIYNPVIQKNEYYRMSLDAIKVSIPYRDGKANFKVGNITADDDDQYCANKKYVDDSSVTTPITETETVVVDTTTVNFALDAEHDTGMYVSAENAISLGSTQLQWNDGRQKYKVIWDGVEYICYVQSTTNPKYKDDGTYTYYDWQILGNGNNKLNCYNKDTNIYPFAITQDKWKNSAEWLVYATTSTAATHTIKVVKIEGTYKKVTPEYQYDYLSMLKNGRSNDTLIHGFSVDDDGMSSGILSGNGNQYINDVPVGDKYDTGVVIFGNGNLVHRYKATGNVLGVTITGYGNALHLKGADCLSPFIAGYKNTITANKGSIHPDAVFGSNNKLTYDGNTTYGLNLVGGNSHTIKNAALSLITGLGNTVECLTANDYIYSNIVGGAGNTVNHDRVIVGGRGNTSDRNNQFIAGTYSAANEKALVKIGNGTKDAHANAFEVLDDNRAKVFGTPTENNDVLRYQDTAVEVETSLMGA